MEFPGNGHPPAEAAVLETGTIKSIRPDKFGFVLTPDGQDHAPGSKKSRGVC